MTVDNASVKRTPMFANDN